MRHLQGAGGENAGLVDVFGSPELIDRYFPGQTAADLFVDVDGSSNTGKAGRSVRMHERVEWMPLTPAEEARYYAEYGGGQLYNDPDSVPYMTSEQLFGGDAAMSWDFGCGRGERVVKLARRNPDVNYVGVDIHTRSLRIGARQAADDELPNVRFIRADANLLLHRIPDGSALETAVMFPAPQPKANGTFADILQVPVARSIHRVLAGAAARFEFASDSAPYFNAKMRLLGGLGIFSCLDVDVRHGLGLADIQTRYQKTWESKGIQTHYATLHPND